jgi:hypothetical protein
LLKEETIDAKDLENILGPRPRLKIVAQTKLQSNEI